MKGLGGVLGSSRGGLGGVLVNFVAVEATSQKTLKKNMVFSTFLCVRGALGAEMGAILGPSWGLRGAILAILGPSEASWGHLGVPRWPKMAPSWPQEAPRGGRGGLLGDLGGLLGGAWGVLGGLGSNGHENIEKLIVFHYFWGPGKGQEFGNTASMLVSVWFLGLNGGACGG